MECFRLGFERCFLVFLVFRVSFWFFFIKELCFYFFNKLIFWEFEFVLVMGDLEVYWVN